GSARSVRASASPDCPGNIQSSSTRSGSARRICACALSASATACTAKPASASDSRNNSWIAGSSSTTRIEVFIPDAAIGSFRDLGANLLGGRVADILASDRLYDVLGHVLGVIADALDRLGDEDDLERGADRPRVLHHVADQLAQDREERRVDRLVVADDLRSGV